MYRPSFCSTAKGSLMYEYLAEASVFHALMAARPGMGLTLVLDDGLFREAARNGFAIAFIGVEVGRDRLGKLQVGHGGVSLRSCGETTMAPSDRL